jgi:hypothetical protein
MKGPNTKLTPDLPTRHILLRLTGDLHARLSKVTGALRTSNNAFIVKQIKTAVLEAELSLFPEDTKDETDD